MLTFDSIRQHTLHLRARAADVARDLGDRVGEIPPGWNNNAVWHIGHLVITPRLLTDGLLGRSLEGHEAYRRWFAKGSSPASWGGDAIPTLAQLVEESREVIDDLFHRYAGELDVPFAKPYTTSAGAVLHTPAEALTFSMAHDGIHLGLLMALRRALQTA